MVSPSKHRDILEALLNLAKPIQQLEADLGALEPGSPVEIMSFEKEHVRNTIRRFLAGEIDASTVEAWAELIELRDDIDFPDEEAMSALHFLANLRMGGLDGLNVGQLIDHRTMRLLLR